MQLIENPGPNANPVTLRAFLSEMRQLLSEVMDPAEKTQIREEMTAAKEYLTFQARLKSSKA